MMFTIALKSKRSRFNHVVLKPFDDLEKAIAWSRNELKTEDGLEHILIRVGDAVPKDPVVWDSRNDKAPVVYQEDLLEADMVRAQAEIAHLDPDPGLIDTPPPEPFSEDVCNAIALLFARPIWTHTPVPKGFPLRLVNARFEHRAASVLGDYDSPVKFNVHYLKGDIYTDFRYTDITVRTAWMMYLDLALEHYDRFGTYI